jgi:integrase
MELGPPKTKNSKRSIPLPAVAVQALYSHRLQQNEHKVKMGSLYEDNDLVFPAENGKPFCPDNIDRYFKPILDQANLPRISFHSLRHTHATLLIKDCKDAKMVSKRLGHYDVAFTMRVYYHFLPEDEKEAMHSFNRILTGEYNNRTGDSSDSVKESLLSSGEQNVNNYLNHTACI